MKNLRLLPEFHRKEQIVKVDFIYDEALISLVKAQKGARWSQTLKCWYFPKADFNLNTFYQSLKGKAYIDYSKLKQTSSPGRSAKDHINDYVIEKAKTLLLGSNESVSQIAYSLGFEYPQGLNKLFKAKVGISPSEYRNLN
ncbi:helix-turn-helix domain-containing protein [Flavobacteriaceae bacterium]|nr:helix-turn-helix domain-containing protein [Flavobacteriaceae bacterium]